MEIPTNNLGKLFSSLHGLKSFMKKPEKLSRQELLQQDRIQKFLYRFVNHLHQHQKFYWSGAFSGVIVLLGLWASFEYHEAEKKDREIRFYTARSPLTRTDLSPDQKRKQTITGLQHFLETEENSHLVAVARLYLGRLLFEEERLLEAQSAYQEVLQHPDTSEILKNAATISLVALHEQMQDWEVAHEMLKGLSSPQWDELRWYTQARIARQEGRTTESEKYLNELVRNSPNSVYRETAETQLMLY